ncbi:hypothetical protein [Streptomyces sp. NPDC058657]|uniref:hypothetical protein n=1 Tax=unclassified Streptomyces TaxID=2593676 RepID=UPI0036660736
MIREQGPGEHGPDDRRIPTKAQVEKEFSGPLAELADASSDWTCSLERYRSDDFLYHVSAFYSAASRVVAVVSTVRPIPVSHRVRSVVELHGELAAFLFNSSPVQPPVFDGFTFATSTRTVNVNGTNTTVSAMSGHGATSAVVTVGTVSVFVSAANDFFQEPPTITLGPQVRRR